MIEIQNLCHTFGSGTAKLTVLDELSFTFREGQSYALLGPSGSGKTTLLSILGLLLSPSSGQVTIAGKSINYKRRGSLTELRRKTIGFVFQHSQLLPFLSVHDNLYLVGRNANLSNAVLRLRIKSLLAALDLNTCVDKHPAQLSGGQRQRVAVARAVLHSPPIVLADEPTAALDWDNGKRVVDLLLQGAKANKSLTITVTHDVRVAERFDHTIQMEMGKVLSQ